MKKILLSNKIDYALVDDDLFEVLSQFKWHMNDLGNRKYAYAWNPYPKAVAMHRVITDCPPDMVVDHKNHNGLDNRRSNLRITTISGNAHNRRNVRGCHYIGYRKKWKATIMFDGKANFLGYFDTEQRARQMYLLAKATVFGINDADEEEEENGD